MEEEGYLSRRGAHYFTCCMCKKLSRGWGNNPEPVKSKGRCCDDCNNTVIMERLNQMKGR
jgi:hypothetical protein